MDGQTANGAGARGRLVHRITAEIGCTRPMHSNDSYRHISARCSTDWKWPILLKNSKSQRHQICIRCECNWECRQIIAARADQRPYIATSTLPSPPSRPSTLRAP